MKLDAILQTAIIKMTTLGERKIEGTQNAPADYETAILATGYGKFNYAMMIMTIPCGLAITFVTTSLSLALPAAQCDLNLTIFDKGLLNGGIYIGMFSVAFIWAYLADTLGRRKLLIIGYILNSICDLAQTLAYRMWYLWMLKILGGAIISGPLTIIMSFISEFHGKKHRDRAILNMGRSFSFGQALLPLLAYLILPLQWRVVIVENVVEFRNWQIYLFICAIPSILSVILISFFPESPKFLMSRGRNDEAMVIFKRIFRINTGRPENEYPIKQLSNELSKDENNISNDDKITSRQSAIGLAALKNGWKQLIPLFHKPHLWNACLVFIIQFVLLLGWNSFRLWLPQIFATFSEYEEHLAINSSIPKESLCSLIEADVLKSKMLYQENSTINQTNVECNANFSGDNYLQSLYIGISIVLVYVVATHLVKYIGNRVILIFSMLLSGLCGLLYFWVTSSLVTLILASIYVSFEMLCSTAIVSVVVAIFPTSLRTMAVSLGLMIGRAGSLIGNVLLPILLDFGCFPPFLMISLAALAGGFLSILLPDTKNKPLL